VSIRQILRACARWLLDRWTPPDLPPDTVSLPYGDFCCGLDWDVPRATGYGCWPPECPWPGLCPNKLHPDVAGLDLDRFTDHP
jgi:hypothetical protein